MGKKQLPEEFKDFIKCLNKNNVKYLLIGGWAVGIYGHPKATKDIDFLLFNDKDNMIQIKKAFCDFFSPTLNLDDLEKFKEEGQIIRIGSSPTMIELLNKASGIKIEDYYKRRKTINIDGINIDIIAIEDLIINKKAAGRSNDIADVEKIEREERYNNGNKRD
jgi:predicted nucleotidyltransferase